MLRGVESVSRAVVTEQGRKEEGVAQGPEDPGLWFSHSWAASFVIQRPVLRLIALVVS